MKGFISGGKSFGGSVVLSQCKQGVVWGNRPAHVFSKAPKCLFYPFSTFQEAKDFARSVSFNLEVRCWTRKTKRCDLEFEVKVALPSGVSASTARAAFEEVSCV